MAIGNERCCGQVDRHLVLRPRHRVVHDGYMDGSKKRNDRTAKVRSILTIGLVMAGLALAACSSTPSQSSASTTTSQGSTSSTTTTSSSATSTTGTTKTAGNQCAFNNLTVTFGSPDGAAGHTYFALNFFNTGSTSCTLYGYPGVSFLDANKTIIGSVTSREGNETPTAVTLKPQGTAVAPVAVTDSGISPCGGSANATYARIYPPGSFSSDLIPITGVYVCSSASTANFEDSFVAPVAAPDSSNAGPGPYSTCNMLTVTAGQGNAGLGHVGVAILFENAGPTTCALYGYPSVTVNANGVTSTVGDTPNGYLGGILGTNVPSVNLPPRSTASSLVEGTDAPVGNATSCPTESPLEVTPPGESHTVTLNTSLPGCSPLQVHPVVTGSTGSES